MIRGALLAGAATLFLFACGAEKAAPKTAPATPLPSAAKKDAAADSGAESAVEYEYAYTPVGKRDPFRSVIDDLRDQPADVVGPDCGPLCKWEIEQLKLVAVISGISNPVAMVEDPTRRGHVVRRGTFIGKRNGKVHEIRSGEVVVHEIYKNQAGKPQVNEVFIRVPQDKVGAKGEDVNLLGPEVTE